MIVAAAGDNVSAGPIGLLVTVLVGIAAVLLVRNMNQRLKRLPREFPPDDDGAPTTDLPDHGPGDADGSR